MRTLNLESFTVESEVVELPVLEAEERSTGLNIFNLLDSLLEKNSIPWSNCISFGCDSASVNTGVHKGVFSFIKKKNPNCLLSGCTLHLVHLAAEKAAHQLEYNPADLLIDIYYYLNKSSVRQGNLKMWQAYYGKEQRSFLKHVSTRWLSIGRCLRRLIDDWRPLRTFFKKEATEINKPGTATQAKAQAIYNVLNSGTAKACALFLNYAVSIFEPFLTANQSDSPQIHMLHYNINRLMREVLTKFVKPSELAQKELPSQVDFTLSDNKKDLSDVSIGSDTEAYIKEHFNDTKRAKFVSNVVNYYSYVMIYM